MLKKFAGVFVSVAPGLAFATGPATLADLTTAVDFATATAAMLAVAVLVIGFKVMKQGAMVVLRWIGFAK